MWNHYYVTTVNTMVHLQLCTPCYSCWWQPNSSLQFWQQTPIAVFWALMHTPTVGCILHYNYSTYLHGNSRKLLLLLNNKFALFVTVSNAGSSAKYDPIYCWICETWEHTHSVNDDTYCNSKLKKSNNGLSAHPAHHILSWEQQQHCVSCGTSSAANISW